MSLRPGSRAAGLLLELWGRQGEGQRWTVVHDDAVNRLLEVGYVKRMTPQMDCYTLTEPGRIAAETLEAGS